MLGVERLKVLPKVDTSQASDFINRLLRSKDPFSKLPSICGDIPYFLPKRQEESLCEGERTELIYCCLPVLGNVLPRFLGLGISRKELFDEGVFFLCNRVNEWDPKNPSYYSVKTFLAHKIPEDLEGFVCRRYGLEEGFKMIELFWRCFTIFVEERQRLPALKEIIDLMVGLGETERSLGRGLWKEGEIEHSLGKGFWKVRVVYQSASSLGFSSSILKSEAVDSSEDQALKEVLRDQVNLVVQTLSPAERKVIFLRFSEDRTLEGIGGRMSFTDERARQVLVGALRKLRHPSRRSYLTAKDY